MDRYQARETVLNDSDISRNARLLYLTLDNYQRDNENCWPRQRTLREKLQCSDRSLRNYLAELVNAGLCRKERTVPGGPNRYQLFHSYHRQQAAAPPATECRTHRQQAAAHKSNQAIKPEEVANAESQRQNLAVIGQCKSCRGSGQVMIPAIGWSSCTPCRGTGREIARRSA
jgi:hypothetical protein